MEGTCCPQPFNAVQEFRFQNISVVRYFRRRHALFCRHGVELHRLILVDPEAGSTVLVTPSEVVLRTNPGARR